MSDCPYVNRNTNDRSIRCQLLREQKSKWDFCVHQYYCNNTHRYENKPEAANCVVKAQKEG